MRCYLGFLLCTLALIATTIASAKYQAHPYTPVGQCPSIDGVYPVLLPDSEDRTIFYMCSHGRPILQRCPPKLVFDPILNTCKHENQISDDKPASYSPVGDCPQVDGHRPVYLPDSNNRTIFYECSNGIPIKQECSSGLVFDPSIDVCVYP